MLTKICSKCGKSYPANECCQCRKQRHKQYDKYERNKDSAAVYHSKSWQLLTQMCKARCNGLDMYKLMMTGRPVVTVNGLSHHIIELEEDKSLAFVLDNLIWVGSDSHAEIHKIYKSSEKNKKDLQQRLKNFLLLMAGGG